MLRHVLPMVISPIVVADQPDPVADDLHRDGAVLSRPRSAAARSELGRHALRSAPVHGTGAADGVGPAAAIVFATLTFIVLANGLREMLDVGSRAMSAAPILRVRDLTARIVTRRETVGGGAGHFVRHRHRRGGRLRRRIRLRQERDGARHHASRAEGPTSRSAAAIGFKGRDLLTLSEAEMRDLRGRRIAMVFQDPMTSLNPVMTVGAQIDDMLTPASRICRHGARAATVELLGQVGIPDPARRADDYPHEFSGGMRQRVLIAIAVVVRSRSADRRRAHHGARRDGAGADPPPADAAAGRARACR